MKKHFIKIFLLVLFVSVACVTFADRGVGKKNKMKTVLNINTGNNFKNSILTNIRYGMTYRGSLLSTTRQTNSNAIANSSLMTYQKGNTTYIIPYKNKLTVPDMRPGYTGVKLILRSKK